MFKVDESTLNIVQAILKYRLKTGIFKTNAAMYPMKEIVDSVVTKRFE
ncbi:hypothetical protein HUB90_07300 [Wolbachia endosymbiont of Kradibia gibbosae]|nr:hypothetical protein [Wolbachia endosymbiont of Kradibia gibbosae]GKS80261.1 hypothetical protein wHmb_11470 [Wolbachia pipientis]